LRTEALRDDADDVARHDVGQHAQVHEAAGIAPIEELVCSVE
jgi:hypothetical protein